MRNTIAGGTAGTPTALTTLEAFERMRSSARRWLRFHQGNRSVELSFAEAWRHAAGWATALREAGVERGDRVAVLQPNQPDFVGAFFGAQILGAAPVPLPWPLLPASGRGYGHLLSLLAAADVAALAVPSSLAEAAPWKVPVVSARAARELHAVADLEPAFPAFLQFTSGSTGAPRGAVIAHRAAVANAWAIGEALSLGESDIGVSWLPLFHDMGLVGVLLASLLWRFEVELLTPAEILLHPERWLELLSETRATLTVAPNFGYELTARRLQGREGWSLGRLRAALCGSEPVQRTTLDQFEAKWARNGLRPGTVLPVYGLAEYTLGVCFSSASAPLPDLEWRDRSVPSVGRPLAGTEVALTGPDGRDVPFGEEGEIRVRGASLMSGYFRDGHATREALADGWLRTGDLGVIRDGALYVTGREKDLVIKGGQKFHPYEIERVAAEAVDAPLNGAAAFSRPNPLTGTEDLVVVVELRRRPEGDPIRRIRGKLMEELGIRAERVQLVGAGELPRTTSGKVRRRSCAERFGGGA